MTINKTLKKIFIASDHAGFQLKEALIKQNTEYHWEDLGSFNQTESHYPAQAELLCRQLLAQDLDTNGALGVLICGSGQGMAIKANRFPGIRAGLAWSEETSRLAREHNNINVLCLGARLLSFEQANRVFKTFVSTPFKEGRHSNRVKDLD